MLNAYLKDLHAIKHHTLRIVWFQFPQKIAWRTSNQSESRDVRACVCVCVCVCLCVCVCVCWWQTCQSGKKADRVNTFSATPVLIISVNADNPSSYQTMYAWFLLCISEQVFLYALKAQTMSFILSCTLFHSVYQNENNYRGFLTLPLSKSDSDELTVTPALKHHVYHTAKLTTV